MRGIRSGPLLIVAVLSAVGCSGVGSGGGASGSELSITFTGESGALPLFLFSVDELTVERGQMVAIAPSDPSLLTTPDWQWYRDGVEDPTQRTASFRWDTTGVQPGHYLINVAVSYQGVRYTGSLRVTVTY